MKYTFQLCLLFGCFLFSCNNDDDAPFDHAGQAIIDDAYILEFLQTHYYDATDNEIYDIDNGQTPISTQVQIDVVTFDNIDYNLYYLVHEEGTEIQPNIVDTILPTYRGVLMDNEEGATDVVFDSSYTLTVNKYANLQSYIPGFANGFTNFKSGSPVLNPIGDGSFSFENRGRGILFIPSGLAYRDNGASAIPVSSCLIFHIELHNAINDVDEDGLTSAQEDLDGDGDFLNDDTDGDLISNCYDADDDNDGTLTIDEIGDDPNNPLDHDSDGTPDYLDDTYPE